VPKFYFNFPNFNSFISGGNNYNKKFEHVLLKNNSIIKTNEIDKADLVISDTIFLKNKETLDLISNPKLRKIIIVHHLKYFEDPTYVQEFSLLNKFDLLIANSNYTSNALQNNGIDARKIIIIEPPVSISNNYIKEKKYITINAVMAANWIERKGFIEMFTAIKKANNYPDNLNITIYGDQTLDKIYFNNCRQMIAESPILSKIINIKEPLLPQQMLTAYQNYNLFLSSSKMETYGMAVKEAVNNGLFVLALNKGNLPYLLSGHYKSKLFKNIDSLVKFLIYISKNNKHFININRKQVTHKVETEDKFELQISNFINRLEAIL